MRSIIKIDIVSDVVCPWCYVGKRQLEAAMVQRPDVDFEITWRAYQLNPDIPPEGDDRQAYMARKFPDQTRYKEMSAILVETGRSVGIAFNFAAITRAPNTLDAHQLLHYAATQGVQNDLKERLFRAYFIDGRDVGDAATLADIGEAAGLRRSEITVLLRDKLAAGAVKDELAIAQQLGITGVPCFIFNQKVGVMGAQTPDVLLQAIDQVLASHQAQA